MVARVLAYEPDLLFSSKIESAGKQFGVEVRVATNMKDVLQVLGQSLPDILLVNLDALRERNESLNELAKQKCRMVGYYSHMEEDSAKEATRAGFEVVVPRRSFAVKLHDILATVTLG